MKKLIYICALLLLSQKVFVQDAPCAPVVKPALAESTRIEFEKKLAGAKEDYNRDTTDADAIIWYGRRLAYLGSYMEAIAIYSKGISHHPEDARMYRHRGHRYITIRCFDKATEDFKKAARLIKGKPDEVEPDGLPNAQNIPTSTLQSNTWYHLGLAYFLKGEYKQALKAYKECLRVSANDDMKVAMVNWTWLVLNKLGKTKEATELLYTVYPNAAVIENFDYLKLVSNLYRDKPGENEVKEYGFDLLKGASPLGTSTISFAVGFYCYVKGFKEQAKEFFEKAVSTNQWSSFGFIAAEAELRRLK